MVVAWGATFDIAIILIRIFKRKKTVIPYYTLHSIFMWITFILSTVFISLMLAENRQLNGSDLPTESIRAAHFVIGLIILGLSFFSLVGGILTMLKIKSSQKNDDTLNMKQKHAYGGYFIYLLSKLNIILGAAFHRDGEWMGAIIGYIAGIILV